MLWGGRALQRDRARDVRRAPPPEGRRDRLDRCDRRREREPRLHDAARRRPPRAGCPSRGGPPDPASRPRVLGKLPHVRRAAALLAGAALASAACTKTVVVMVTPS